MVAEIPDLICRTGYLAQLSHFSPEVVLVNLCSIKLKNLNFIIVQKLRFELQILYVSAMNANISATQAK
jgi:hypothetical protein